MKNKIQQKYISFPKHQAFQPMLSPIDMLNLGIFGGKPFKDSRVALETFPKLDQADETKWMNDTTIQHGTFNYFETTSDHDEFKAREFFYWYTELYFHPMKERTTGQKFQDNRFIEQWAKKLHELWKPVKYNEIQDIYLMEDVTRQTMLEMAWNPFYKPNFTLEQCLSSLYH